MDNKQEQNKPGQQNQKPGQQPGGGQKPEQQKHDDLIKKIKEDDRQANQTDGTVGGT